MRRSRGDKVKRRIPAKDSPHFLWLSLAVILCDQLLKLLIRREMALGQSIPIIQGVFHLTYLQNTGAGFGMLQGKTMLLIWFSVMAVGALLYWYDTLPKTRLRPIALGLIIGGTVSNVIDRAVLGSVTDFLDFRIWPVFNLGDACLCIGVLLLLLCLKEHSDE